jgi:hypothetical protein
MKLALLFVCTVAIGEAAVIYTEPVRVSGGGWAYCVSSDCHFDLEFKGSNGEIQVEMRAVGYLDRFLDNTGNIGLLSYNPMLWEGSATITDANGAELFHTALLEYALSTYPFRSGLLTLYDDSRYPQPGEHLATVPLISYYVSSLTEYIQGDEYDTRRWITYVYPVPEPATWQLSAFGALAVAAMWRRRRTLTGR